MLLGVTAFARDSWKAYSDPFPVRSVAPYQGGLLLATDGGIRVLMPEVDLVYTAADGLETSKFNSIIVSDRGVYAVSEYGLIAKMRDGYNGWDVLGRSYVSNGARLVPDKSKIVGNVLILVFENSMAFFDLDKKVSILTIDRIGNVSLSAYPPVAVAVRGDSLYVSTLKKLFVRKMDWSNVAGDIHLIDPESWTLLPTSGVINSIAWKGSELKLFPYEGFWSWNGDVETSSVQDSAKKILLNGVPLKNEDLYYNDVSLVKWIFQNDDGSAYLVSSQTIWKYQNGKFKDLSNLESYSLGEVYELTKYPQGGVVAASIDGHFAFANDFGWAEPYTVWDLPISNSSSDAYGHRIKTLAVSPYGFVLSHFWGQGFFISAKMGELILPFILAGNGYCMDEYLERFTISAGATVSPDSTGFLVTTASSEGYSVVYISIEGEMSCANQVGKAQMGGPIQARFDENGDWVVYVGSREEISASANGGLDVFTFTPPSKNGGRLVSTSMKSYPALGGNTPIDMVLDSKNEVLWLVSNADLAYFELDQDTVYSPPFVKGLQNPEFTSIDVDTHGNIWVGTQSQGAYRIHRDGASFDTLSSTRFTTKNGLLDNFVSDVAVDPVLGMAWFSHEKGVTAYTRDDLRNASAFMTDEAPAEVKAFPNPFRPLVHIWMTIDNIPEDATVSIFNRGGSLIRFFSGSDLVGGRAEWDGLGKNGELVAPGVYHYVVRTSSKKKTGKIIVIH